MNDERTAKHKTELVNCETDSYYINQVIEQEAQVGWYVKQIIYIEHVHSVLILFERK